MKKADLMREAWRLERTTYFFPPFVHLLIGASIFSTEALGLPLMITVIGRPTSPQLFRGLQIH